MSENKPNDGGDTTKGMTVVTVPQEHAQALIEFVAGLDADGDVSGHMISRGMLAGISGGLAAKGGRSLTGCTFTTGDDEFGHDWQCSDTDR